MEGLGRVFFAVKQPRKARNLAAPPWLENPVQNLKWNYLPYSICVICNNAWMHTSIYNSPNDWVWNLTSNVSSISSELLELLWIQLSKQLDSLWISFLWRKRKRKRKMMLMPPMETRSLHEQYIWLTDDGWIQCVQKLSEQLKCYWNALDIFFTAIMYLVHKNNKTWC